MLYDIINILKELRLQMKAKKFDTPNSIIVSKFSTTFELAFGASQIHKKVHTWVISNVVSECVSASFERCMFDGKDLPGLFATFNFKYSAF